MISIRKAAFIVLAALCMGQLPQASAEPLKIGTVDMTRVFDSYYKTKDAEAKINEERNAAKKELEDRLDVARKALNEIKKLDEEIQNPALSQEEKERKSKIRGDKAIALENMDREIRDFQTSREKQLQEQSMRMRAGIVDDINKVVADRVKAESYNLVLDKSGPSLNSVPVVLFATESYDFTDDLILILNKNRGKEEAATPSGGSATDATPKHTATVGGKKSR